MPSWGLLFSYNESLDIGSSDGDENPFTLPLSCLIDEDTDEDGVGNTVDLCPTVGSSIFGIDANGCPKPNPQVNTNIDNVKLYVAPVFPRVSDAVFMMAAYLSPMACDAMRLVHTPLP